VFLRTYLAARVSVPCAILANDNRHSLLVAASNLDTNGVLVLLTSTVHTTLLPSIHSNIQVKYKGGSPMLRDKAIQWEAEAALRASEIGLFPLAAHTRYETR